MQRVMMEKKDLEAIKHTLMWKFFDGPQKTHGLFTKFLNVMAVTTIDLLWLILILCFLALLLALSPAQITNIMQPLSFRQ